MRSQVTRLLRIIARHGYGASAHQDTDDPSTDEERSRPPLWPGFIDERDAATAQEYYGNNPDKNQESSNQIAVKGSRDSVQLVIAVAAVLALVVSTVSNIFLYRVSNKSAEAAQTSAEVAKQQTELANRPWVRAAVTASKPYAVDKDGGSIGLALKYRNEGRSPAAQVTTGAKLFVLELERSAFVNQPAAQMEEACKLAEASSGSLPGGAFSPALTIFPRDSLIDGEASATISREELDAAAQKVTAGGPIDAQIPMLAVCVFYRFAYDLSRSDQTRYLFFVVEQTLLPAPWPLVGNENVGAPLKPRTVAAPKAVHQ